MKIRERLPDAGSERGDKREREDIKKYRDRKRGEKKRQRAERNAGRHV